MDLDDLKIEENLDLILFTLFTRILVFDNNLIFIKRLMHVFCANKVCIKGFLFEVWAGSPDTL